MRKPLLVGLVAAAAVAVPLVATSGTASAERRCYTPHVGGLDTFEVCHYLPIDLEPAAVVAEPGIPGLPDPTDCHSMQDFFGIKNVMSCDGPPVE